MPRIRTLKPDIWQDEKLADVGFEARLLFVGLITQADDEGRLQANPRRLGVQVFPYDALPPEQVETWLAELDRAGLIQRYAHAGRPFLHLSAWGRNQKIDRPLPSRLPAPDDPESEPYREDSSSARDGSRGLAPGVGREGEPETSEPLSGESGSDTTTQGKGGEPQRSELPTGGRLSDLLADLVAKNDPNDKRPNVTQRWLDAERHLITTDGRPADQVERVIRWVAQDEFESANVLSMPKLRKRYPQLVRKARVGGKSPNGSGPLPAPSGERRAAA